MSCLRCLDSSQFEKCFNDKISITKLLKKTIFIIISFAVLGLTFYYFKNIYGWMEFRKKTDTPDKFLNNTLNK